MQKNRRLPLALMASVALSLSLPAVEVQAASATCGDFDSFKNAFIASEQLQKDVARIPLALSEAPVDGRSKVPPVKLLSRQQIVGPLLPAEASLKKASLSVVTELEDTALTRLWLVNADGYYVKTYSFQKRDCWELISIHDETALSARLASKENAWLERVFRSPRHCTPQSLYYDVATRASGERQLEKKGYKPGSVDDSLANYAIKERFYGLNAIALAIPSATDSVYAVTVEADARTLARRIQASTGIAVPVYRQGMKTEDGVAYIMPKGAGRSEFVCASPL